MFENERDGRIYRSVNLQRSYRRNCEWARMSMYLDHEHIPFFIEVLEGTWKFLNEHPAGGSAVQEADSDTVNEQVDDIHDETHAAA